MIQSFVFSDGKLAGRDLEIEALRIVRADKGLVLWVDLENPTDEEIKTILEGVFQFHPLAIEDCMTPSSLPKIEDYEDYLFVVTHAVEFTRTTKFATMEVDMFHGKDYLVTFHRTAVPSVTIMRDRMTKNAGVIARGPDRLAHTLLDLIVDHYGPVMDELRSELEEIEERMLARTPEKEFVNELLHVRGDFSRLRTIIRPQRDMIEKLARGESKMIRPIMLPYYRDVRDNLARLDETAINYHERLMLAFDIFLNKAAFEANEGIKFLTAVTAVTLPAVIIGGWYGMNFAHMPELQWRHGYLYAWTLMLTMTLVMIFYIKKKKWF
ncbi:magnesium/cobalt transporter CorA [Horticoccus luteus]|uniref:Magnesium transport protein CorA n=1 Tax=Horticoccus luteus TaxID=2862869 RepID=A0A8F9XK92_9BACT|nr:magnesium/cobalt transporter CorA [Horticoccus luteus]QYM79463.1 magnesium/cobalt transporter CorA [Horticoccus luteus]